MSLVLGIDPGKGGAVVGLDRGITTPPGIGVAMVVSAVADTASFLVRTGKGAKREYDEDAMAAWLAALGPVELAVLESQQAMPATLRGRKQGVSSSFSTGVGFGLWRMGLAAFAIPRIIVHPRTWTAALLKGAPGEGKERTVAVVRRLLPALDLGTKSKAQARADAACLALYGLRQLGRDGESR